MMCFTPRVFIQRVYRLFMNLHPRGNSDWPNNDVVNQQRFTTHTNIFCFTPNQSHVPCTTHIPFTFSYISRWFTLFYSVGFSLFSPSAGSTAVADPLFDESWCMSGCSARGIYPCGFSPCFICIFLSCFSMTCTLSSTVLSTFPLELPQPIFL